MNEAGCLESEERRCDHRNRTQNADITGKGL